MQGADQRVVMKSSDPAGARSRASVTTKMEYNMRTKKQSARAMVTVTPGVQPVLPGPVALVGNRRRKFDPRFFENFSGCWADFSYSQLRRDGRGTPVTATGYLREKLRWPSGPLDTAPLARDVAGNSLVLPPAAPDVFSRPAQVWRLVDDDTDAWKSDRHLLVSVTLWFPWCRTTHLAHRASVTFAQTLADDFGVAAQVVLHDPSRISHAGDVHSHVVITANEVRSSGRGMFVQPLLADTAQRMLWDRWQAILAALPAAQRP